MPHTIFLTRGPRAHRPVENQPTAHGTRARALRGADLVVVQGNLRRAPPQLHGYGPGARPPHQVGGCGFELWVLPRPIPAARGPRAHRRVENRPTAHRTHARALRSAG